jgi:hypothetical protein
VEATDRLKMRAGTFMMKPFNNSGMPERIAKAVIKKLM